MELNYDGIWKTVMVITVILDNTFSGDCVCGWVSL
jgi:hypothetical protein